MGEESVPNSPLAVIPTFAEMTVNSVALGFFNKSDLPRPYRLKKNLTKVRRL